MKTSVQRKLASVIPVAILALYIAVLLSYSIIATQFINTIIQFLMFCGLGILLSVLYRWVRTATVAALAVILSGVILSFEHLWGSALLYFIFVAAAIVFLAWRSRSLPKKEYANMAYLAFVLLLPVALNVLWVYRSAALTGNLLIIGYEMLVSVVLAVSIRSIYAHNRASLSFFRRIYHRSLKMLYAAQAGNGAWVVLSAFIIIAILAAATPVWPTSGPTSMLSNHSRTFQSNVTAMIYPYASYYIIPMCPQKGGSATLRLQTSNRTDVYVFANLSAYSEAVLSENNMSDLKSSFLSMSIQNYTNANDILINVSTTGHCEYLAMLLTNANKITVSTFSNYNESTVLYLGYTTGNLPSGLSYLVNTYNDEINSSS